MKKQLKIYNFIFVICILFFIAGCKYQDIEIDNINSIDVKEISSKNIALNVLVNIKNPNNYKIKVKTYDIDIIVNNQNFDLLETTNNLIIPKKYEGPLTVPIVLDIKEALSFNTLKSIYNIMSQKEITVEAIGRIKVKVLVMSKEIKLNEKRTIKLNGNK